MIGSQLWLAHDHGNYGGAGASAGELGVSPDGTKIFVAGWVDDGTSGQDYFTLGYDAATGAGL